MKKLDEWRRRNQALVVIQRCTIRESGGRTSTRGCPFKILQDADKRAAMDEFCTTANNRSKGHVFSIYGTAMVGNKQL